MKKSLLVLVGVALASSAIASTFLLVMLPSVRPDVEGIATVRFSDLGGGCFYLDAEDGNRYEPIALSEDYRYVGLRVYFSARILDDVHSTCSFGAVVEIMDLREVFEQA